MSETLVHVFHAGMSYEFARVDQESPSTFGGAITNVIIGIPHGPAPLHQLARLRDVPVPLPMIDGVGAELSLLYGFCFDGSELEYEVQPDGSLNIISSSNTESSLGWPYEGYPVQFPAVYIRAAKTRAVSYEDFSCQWPSMPGLQPAEVLVMVPPPTNLGVSLWGQDGDDEGVTVVFEFDPKLQRVKTYNVCS